MVAAIDAAAAQLGEPENAVAAVNTLDAVADLLEHLAAALGRVGTGVTDTVYFAPEVAHHYESLGQHVAAAVGPTREGATAVRQRHADRLEEIEQNDPKVRKWDLSAHRDY